MQGRNGNDGRTGYGTDRRRIFLRGRTLFFGIDLSEGQTAEYSDFTAVREKVYGISADLSRKTKLITFVDGWSSRAVSDFLKVRIKICCLLGKCSAESCSQGCGKRLKSSAVYMRGTVRSL
ncbi:MAG: hypothetical protein L6V87_10165 [Ruminococcus sp.]|nr:MAG: hypothetical protein L6V87_10165 [Ruminococcus sp.]